MATRIGSRLRLVVVCAAAAGLAGCGFPTEVSGPTERETRTVEIGNVESVEAEMHMPAGELRITGGTDKLMDGEFVYNVPSWKPYIRYTANGFRGHLLVEQKGRGVVGHAENRWNLSLNEKVPLELTLHLGAGESRLDLGRMNLRRLVVHIGAGHIDLNLTGGEIRHNFAVEIHGGVGQCEVRLPHSVGAIAEVHGGLGGIHTDGMLARGGNTWVNRAYDSSPVKISIQIHGGIGDARLISE